MDPFIVIIVLIVFSFAGYMGKKGIELERLKIEGKRGGGDNSMGVSELKGLIRQAVEEANAPLHARIEELEAQVGQQESRRLPSAPRPRELSTARPEEDF